MSVAVAYSVLYQLPLFVVLLTVNANCTFSPVTCMCVCDRSKWEHYYLRQGGYVFIVVCLLATLRKNFRTDLHVIFRQSWQWSSDEIIKFRGNPDHHLDTGIVFRICHCWEV